MSASGKLLTSEEKDELLKSAVLEMMAQIEGIGERPVIPGGIRKFIERMMQKNGVLANNGAKGDFLLGLFDGLIPNKSKESGYDFPYIGDLDRWLIEVLANKINNNEFKTIEECSPWIRGVYAAALHHSINDAECEAERKNWLSIANESNTVLDEAIKQKLTFISGKGPEHKRGVYVNAVVPTEIFSVTPPWHNDSQRDFKSIPMRVDRIKTELYSFTIDKKYETTRDLIIALLNRANELDPNKKSRFFQKDYAQLMAEIHDSLTKNLLLFSKGMKDKLTYLIVYGAVMDLFNDIDKSKKASSDSSLKSTPTQSKLG